MGNDDRILTKTMLETLGFQKKYIDRAIRVYEKNYGTEHYSQDELIQIILRLQDKEEMKRQKEQLLAMNLEPKLAQEIFGMNKFKKKKKSKSSGYHSGDIVVYRDEIKGQILDKMDEYIQVSWPLNKPIYQRAVLWINMNEI